MIFIIFSYMYLSCHCLMCLALPSLKAVPLLIYPCPVKYRLPLQRTQDDLAFSSSPFLVLLSLPFLTLPSLCCIPHFYFRVLYGDSSTLINYDTNHLMVKKTFLGYLMQQMIEKVSRVGLS